MLGGYTAAFRRGARSRARHEGSWRTTPCRR
jgi:hypothetical protein